MARLVFLGTGLPPEKKQKKTEKNDVVLPLCLLASNSSKPTKQLWCSSWSFQSTKGTLHNKRAPLLLAASDGKPKGQDTHFAGPLKIATPILAPSPHHRTGARTNHVGPKGQSGSEKRQLWSSTACARFHLRLPVVTKRNSSSGLFKMDPHPNQDATTKGENHHYLYGIRTEGLTQSTPGILTNLEPERGLLKDQ